MAQTVRSRIEAAAKNLKRHGQEHLMQFSDRLSQEEKLLFLEDIESLDLGMIDELIEKYIGHERATKLPDDIQPAEVYPVRASSRASLLRPEV